METKIKIKGTHQPIPMRDLDKGQAGIVEDPVYPEYMGKIVMRANLDDHHIIVLSDLDGLYDGKFLSNNTDMFVRPVNIAVTIEVL